MKHLSIISLFALLLVFSCGKPSGENAEIADAESSEESISNELNGDSYGATLSESEIVDIGVLASSLNSTSEFEGKIKVEIEDVCQMKGCWMTAKLPDGRTMRITFKDYGFFVPKNSAGKTAIIEGSALVKVTDEETLKHYAQESGKSSDEIAEITGPGEELSFVASGVIIEGGEE